MDMMDWLLVIRVNYKKNQYNNLITIENNFFCQGIKYYFDLCFIQNRFFVKP